MPRVTVRKRKSESGLASISQSPRGVTVHVDGVRVAIVQGNRDGTFFWYTMANPSLGIEHRNTASEPPKSLDEAKSEAVTYIKACLTQRAMNAPVEYTLSQALSHGIPLDSVFSQAEQRRAMEEERDALIALLGMKPEEKTRDGRYAATTGEMRMWAQRDGLGPIPTWQERLLQKERAGS